jgi:hypothetical protein
VDIPISEPPADVDHPAVAIIMNSDHSTVVADVLNQPLFVVDTPNTDLCLQVVEVLQVVDVNTINL